MRRNNNMMWVIILVIVAAVVLIAKYISGTNTNYNNRIPSYKKKSGEKNIYTEKDRDMMELIHELSEVYHNTDQFLDK